MNKTQIATNKTRSERIYLGKTPDGRDRWRIIIHFDPTWSVGASSDDCRVRWTGSAWTILLNATELNVGYFSSSYWKYGGGMRFAEVIIPQGATIDTSYCTIVCGTPGSVTTVNSRITGEDVDNAATWSTLANYQARRGTVVGGSNNDYITDAQVDWDAIPAWTDEASYNSPSIVSIIQEIVNRGGWASGNALALFWDDHDDRSTHVSTALRIGASYDRGGEYDPPALTVEFTVVGWTGKISGVTNPAKIMGVDVANIAKVKGVA